MKKLASIIQIIRPLNVLITLFTIIVAGVICSKGEYLWLNILLASFSGALAASAGNIINDIIDIEIDRINRPERALPSGKLSIKEAYFLYGLFNLAGLVLAFFVNGPALLIYIISAAVIFLYSYRMKGIPLIGNFVVGILTALAFTFGGVAAGNWKFTLIPAFFAFLINLIREIIKDMEDVEGDSRMSVITFPQKYGFSRTVRVISFLTILLMLFTLIPFLLHIYTIEYFVLVMSGVNLLFIFFLKLLLWPEGGHLRLRLMSNVLKINMILGLIAIYAGNK
ncbi:MAG: geranylgeranylglycerol-phosphate geranylgeranyltransferase [Acidobacteriota bacterium]